MEADSYGIADSRRGGGRKLLSIEEDDVPLVSQAEMQTSSASRLSSPFSFITALGYTGLDLFRQMLPMLRSNSNPLDSSIRQTVKTSRDVILTPQPIVYGTEESNSVPALKCSGPGYQTLVFFKPFNPSNMISDGTISHPLPIVEDFYQQHKGANTTFVYMPTLPARPLESLDGNIMLGAVAVRLVQNTYHWAKSLFGFRSDEMAKKQHIPSLSRDDFQRKIAKIEEHLNRFEQKIKVLPPKDREGYTFGLEEHRYHLQELENSFEVGKLDESAFYEFNLEVLQASIDLDMEIADCTLPTAQTSSYDDTVLQLRGTPQGKGAALLVGYSAWRDNYAALTGVQRVPQNLAVDHHANMTIPAALR